jgi:hypothetical protein
MLGSLLAAPVVALAAAGAASGAGTLLTPLVAGWEKYFKIESELVEVYGRPIIRGYVLNDWGFVARRIQLLFESLDDNGNVLAQRVDWLTPSVLTPGTRAYFEAVAPAFSLRYRVSVYAFDWDVERRRRFP